MNKQIFYSILVAILLLFIVRLISLGSLGLADPSEGRYAAIAQSMLLLGDPVTPWTFVKSLPEPFLGKPPLLFWMVAGSYRLFGMTEFSTRLPSMLSGVGTCLCVALFALRFFNPLVAALSVFILSTTILFFFLSGACLIDPLLTMAVTLAITSFAICLSKGEEIANNYWRGRVYSALFFIGLALGMLSKGPVSIILVGLPLFVWLVSTKSFRLLKQLNWVSGIVLFLLLTAPWFLLAEARNPGFLNYFFIHENFLRYLVKDYGDRYGTGHQYPLGSIWIMLFIAAMPWTPLMIFGATKQGRRLYQGTEITKWVGYVVLWGLAPALFFTFAKQVTAAYILPGLPGLAIFSAVLLYEGLIVRRSVFIARFLTALAFLLPLALLGIVLAGELTAEMPAIAFISYLSILGLFWLAIRTLRVDPIKRVISVGFGLAILFGVGVPNLKPIIDEESSSNTLMAYLEEPIKNEPHVIGFFIKAPYSAFFYGRDEKLDVHQVRTFSADEIESAKADVYVVSEDQVKHLDQSKFSVTAKVGDWLIIRPHQPGNEL